MIAHLMQRIKLIFSWGKVTRAEQDKLQVEFPTGDINDNIKYLHHYGFISRATPNATAYCIFIGGDRSRGYAILTEDKQVQLDLQPGEVAVIDDKNNIIHLTSDGIRIKSASKVMIEGGNVEITGNLSVDGSIESTGNISDSAGLMADIRTSYNSHNHTGNQGAPTSPPNPTM